MTTLEPIRVAVSGAAGRIGYSLVFRIAAGGLFGPERPVALSLLEHVDARSRLEACAMELQDCAFPLLTELKIGVDSREMFADAEWVIVLGGAPFTVDRANRFDLLRGNAPVMVEHGRAINQAAPNARILVVTQPCNTNCLIVKSQAPNVPAEHWFALTQLARLRAMRMISEKTRVPVAQISRVTVWGNNSRLAHVDLQNARVGDKSALEAINDPDWIINTLGPTVASRGREVLRVRGTSPAGSVTQAIVGTIRSITTPTPYERWFAAGVVSDGAYRVPRGLVFGFPVMTPDGKGWSIVHGLYVDDSVREHIAANVAELELEAAAVSHLLGKI